MKGRRIPEIRQNVSRTFLRPSKCQVIQSMSKDDLRGRKNVIIPSLLFLLPSLMVLFNITNAACEPFNPTYSTLSESHQSPFLAEEKQPEKN